MIRKYMTEVGLNVSLQNHTLALANRLAYIESFDSNQYHLYAILCGDKVYFDEKETKIICKHEYLGLDVSFFYFDEDNNRITCKMPYTLIVASNINNKLDYSKVNMHITYPNELLRIDITDKNFIAEHGEKYVDLKFMAQDLFYTYASLFLKEMKLKVLYVGQAYGNSGDRNAFNRLSSHSTYQKIMSELNERYPTKSLYIYLMEINHSIITSINPKQETLRNDIEDKNHFKQVICNLPIERQVINITEAAIINYFKPEYNKIFIDNFPNQNHKGYKQYFDLDYNALTVEMYPDYDDLPSIVLYTDSAMLNSEFDFIKYNLHNDSDRKNMYDIFSEKC